MLQENDHNLMVLNFAEDVFLSM